MHVFFLRMYALGVCFGRMLWGMLWVCVLGVCFGRVFWACVLRVCFGRVFWAYALSVLLWRAGLWAIHFEYVVLGVCLWPYGFCRRNQKPRTK